MLDAKLPHRRKDDANRRGRLRLLAGRGQPSALPRDGQNGKPSIVLSGDDEPTAGGIDTEPARKRDSAWDILDEGEPAIAADCEDREDIIAPA